MIARTLSSIFGLAPGAPLEPIEIMEEKFAGIRSLPSVGTFGLYAVIVLAAFAFALGVASSSRPRLLRAARSAAYATCALVLFDICLLAYAFISHDFRIRYVARYSDRSMTTGYLLTALWGGQDGSLLWWIFLLSANTAACLLWMRNRWRELQPYVIATLMAIMMFFGIIMAFSANPFSESIAGARVDGEGLNPLLQNFYMIIHPPSLYTGFVGCAVPFAFCVAALGTGRLGEEWLYAVRRWMLFAWVFLGIGNTLGMLWAYEELGWGGYWAWDPVENAAFMPWLTASAFVHSIMIQERRRMLKLWNVLLIAQTFFMTIFGTFLTRSGMIASVHAFAQSNIGIYFTYFMVTIACVTCALIVLRLPELKNFNDLTQQTLAYRKQAWPRILQTLAVTLVAMMFARFQTTKMLWLVLITAGSILLMVVAGSIALKKHFPTSRPATIDAVLSREAAFVANNWVLLAMQLFVLITTIFPLISETVTGEKVTVGPAFYNRWMVPLGLILFALMGVGPLLGWRKTSDAALRKAFQIPLAVTAGTAVLHVALGRAAGFPAGVASDPIYPGILGPILAALGSTAPVVATSLAAFNTAVIVQEYWRGTAARMRAHAESLFTALTQLVSKSRRRYGGYIVHFGIVLMFLGFAGSAYKVDQEVALRPGESHTFSGYTFTYLRPRMEVDATKRMVFVDIAVHKGDRDLGVMSPARFVYTRQQMPTSEVAIRPGVRDDIYIAPGNVNSETKLATLHVFINPVTSWIWIGVMILLMGAAVSTWPDASLGEVGVSAYLRTAGATAASLVLGLLLAMTPARAHASSIQPTGGGSSLHAGDVKMTSPQEKQLFTNLLCMCGTCDRLPLSMCACGWADDARAKLSARLASGATIDTLTEEYVKEHGTASLNVPPSRGFLRSIWLVPVVLIAGGAVGAVFLVRKWAKPGVGAEPARKEPGAAEKKDDYDSKLDDELTHGDDR
jgi:cytochrome c-type biogenesis protein CcmF